ncbi:MAG: hypothetical protein IPP32_00895 [Bacteroidetes bacterium]|nr:hypothetical protein [Bacteroidota bacterium]
MEISNSNNFYLIKGSSILFWGMDIPSKEIELTNSIKEFIKQNDVSIDEVVEISDTIDEELYNLFLQSLK